MSEYSPPDIAATAREMLSAFDEGRQIATVTARDADFDMERAYAVAAAVRRMREARGERVVGRKIGFTNRTIWAQYGVYAPIWGYVYDHTVAHMEPTGDAFPLAGLSEPLIEPEIAFGLSRAPLPEMDARALLGCIEWVAHGFEIVHSIFPGWGFHAEDTVAALGMHGALLLGPPRRVAGEEEAWLASLGDVEIDLVRDGAVVDHGHSRNVLGGPLFALKALIDVLARDPVNPPLAAGEIVTTGALTRALPIAPGQTWSTKLTGIDLDPIGITVS